MVEQLTFRDGYEMKIKRAGEKKPFVESITKPSRSRKLGKHVHHERVIDRENDEYYEKVTDYESGEVIHEQREPLSMHIGHGSAKKKLADK